MSMTRRRLLDDSFKKSVVGNPAIATDSLARMYPGIVMKGWTTQDGTPTPEAPVPIVSAGTQNQETGKWEYEITIANAQTDATQNQTVTLTADRPLTKWDRLEKRNGQWGWVYGSEENVLNGTENIVDYSTTENAQIFVLYDFPINSKNKGGNVYDGESCNILQYEEGAINGMKKDVFEIFRSGNVLWTAFSVDVSYTIESFKEMLRSKYEDENPLTILFETDTETFVPLTSAEQEAMNALYTYRPTTVLSNQQNCQMTLTYKTRKGVGGG